MIGYPRQEYPPFLNISLYCNLLHFGREGRRSGMTRWRASFGGMTRWRASFGGKRPIHGPFFRISTCWWVNRATEPPLLRGSKCFQIASAHVAGNMSSDAAASLSSSHSQTQVTRWWVILSGTRPSSPNPRPKLPQSHSLAHSMRIQMHVDKAINYNA